MRQHRLAAVLLTYLAMALPTTLQAADEPPAQSPCSGLHAWWCRWTAHLRTEPGPCGTWPPNLSAHTDARAGYPREISRLAQPSIDNHESGGYIGGGSASWWRAEPRTRDEGTWGWDYRTSRVVCDPYLLWWHGKRYQGGSGAYKTDGPCTPDLPPVAGR